MIEFRRNKETGILEVWKDGEYVGDIVTMGDKVNGETDSEHQDRE